VARALGLNEDLTEAVALGHDLGHTPFGHAGEALLREVNPGGFDHYKQSLRVVDFLEKNGQGLNLTYEVRNGIIKHSKGKGAIMPDSDGEKADTLEGQVVRVCDTIAYVNHDLDDALRAGVIGQGDIPQDIVRVLGDTHSKRIDTMVRDLVHGTVECGMERLVMSAEALEAVYGLRDFLFEKVYESDIIKTEFTKAKHILRSLYEYYLENNKNLMEGLVPCGEKADPHRAVCDFVAGMTDRFALMTYEKLFIPERWTVF
jgi:dGTPase